MRKGRYNDIMRLSAAEASRECNWAQADPLATVLQQTAAWVGSSTRSTPTPVHMSSACYVQT